MKQTGSKKTRQNFRVDETPDEIVIMKSGYSPQFGRTEYNYDRFKKGSKAEAVFRKWKKSHKRLPAWSAYFSRKAEGENLPLLKG